MPFVIDYSPVAALGSLAVSSGEAQGKGETYQRAFEAQRRMDQLAVQINQQNRLADLQTQLRQQALAQEQAQFQAKLARTPTPEQAVQLAAQQASLTEGARQAASEPYRIAASKRTAEQAVQRQEAATALTTAQQNAKYEAVRQQLHQQYGADQGESMYQTWLQGTLQKQATPSGGGPSGGLGRAAYLAAKSGDFSAYQDFVNNQMMKYQPEKLLEARTGAQAALMEMSPEELQRIRPNAPADLQQFIDGLLATKLAVPANVRSAAPTGSRQDLSGASNDALYNAFRIIGGKG